tara:strand:- start:50792 stop:51895 length:1104 start_codon:yes stop_codon:yes gene_type:complete
MKALLFNILLMAVMYPAIPNSGGTINPKTISGKYTKEKKISKSFEVSANDLLKIDNSYGNINVTTWNENRIEIDVVVKVNGNDEGKVKEKLNDINIKMSQTAEGVFAKTYLEKENRSWWDVLFGDSNNLNMEISYTIKTPVNNNIHLINDYGNIYLDKLKGNAKIDCDYGSIDIGELLGESNYINIDYSRNSHIGTVKNAVINADYSEFEVEDARFVDLNADYSKSKFGKVEYLKFSCDYGSLTVDKVKKIEGNADYLNTRIGQVHHSLDLGVDYGNVEIEKVVKGARTIKIASDYAGVKIGYAQDQAFSFDVESSYGSVNGLEDFNIQKQSKESTQKNYSGYYMNSSNSANINIKSSYAKITFQKK